jgi:hypothetical protein
LFLQLEFGLGEGSIVSRFTITGGYYHFSSGIRMDSLHQNFFVGQKLGLGL